MSPTEGERLARVEADLENGQKSLLKVEKRLDAIDAKVSKVLVAIEAGKMSGRGLLAVASIGGGIIATVVGWFLHWKK